MTFTIIIVIHERNNNFSVVNPWKVADIMIWEGKLKIKFITGKLNSKQLLLYNVIVYNI